MKESILLELKKYDLKSLYKITFGFAFIPFILTCIFIVLKSEELIYESITLEYFSKNYLGFWMGLFYPFFVILLTQTLIDVEKKSNSLIYYKAYKTNWFAFIIKKIVIAFYFLLVLTFSNLITSTIILHLADYYIADKNSEQIILYSIKIFVFSPLCMLPTTFLHSFFVYFFRSSYVSFALGFILIIVGIPLVNLFDIYYNPYSNGLILMRDLQPNYLFIGWCIFVIFISVFCSNFILRK
jgi:hypothetical protein